VIIRDATTDDVDAICTLAAERRHIYQGYEPRFWRVAANAREVNEPWIA
jgi:hypothetical protein